jgi:hypothetical protein
MSATHFSDGNTVTATFVNTLFDAGGHYHDGTDADGHARKIDLTRDTTGTLPFSRVQSNSTDGSFYVSYVSQFELERHYWVYYKKTTSTDSSAPAKVDLFFPYLRYAAGSVPTTFGSDGCPVPADLRPKNDGYPDNRGCQIPVNVYAGSLHHDGFLLIKKDGSMCWGLDDILE